MMSILGCIVGCIVGFLEPNIELLSADKWDLRHEALILPYG